MISWSRVGAIADSIRGVKMSAVEPAPKRSSDLPLLRAELTKSLLFGEEAAAATYTLLAESAESPTELM